MARLFIMAMIGNCKMPGSRGSSCFLDRKRMNNTATIHITHYQRVVVVLNETIRLMAEIDSVTETHGGWPGAFQPANEGKDLVA